METRFLGSHHVVDMPEGDLLVMVCVDCNLKSSSSADFHHHSCHLRRPAQPPFLKVGNHQRITATEVRPIAGDFIMVGDGVRPPIATRYFQCQDCHLGDHTLVTFSKQDCRPEGRLPCD